MLPTHVPAGVNALSCGTATVTGCSSSSGGVSSESIVTTFTSGMSSTAVTARTVTSYSSAVFGGALSVTVGAVHVERRRAVAVDHGGLEGEFLVVGGAVSDVLQAEGDDVGDDPVRHGAVDERVLERVADGLADRDDREAGVRIDRFAKLA